MIEIKDTRITKAHAKFREFREEFSNFFGSVDETLVRFSFIESKDAWTMKAKPFVFLSSSLRDGHRKRSDVRAHSWYKQWRCRCRWRWWPLQAEKSVRSWAEDLCDCRWLKYQY